MTIAQHLEEIIAAAMVCIGSSLEMLNRNQTESYKVVSDRTLVTLSDYFAVNLANTFVYNCI